MFAKFPVKALASRSRQFNSTGPNLNSIKQNFVVTILDGADKMGRNVALLLKQCPLISELRLYDRDKSICVIAEDLSHIDTNTKVTSYCGFGVLKHAVLDADLILSVGGCRQKAHECARHLFEKNVDNVRSAALHCIAFNPRAIFCVSNPPIEAFVPLVSEEYKKAGVYDARKIIGISSIGCMRAKYYVSLISGRDPSNVRCAIVGGISKNCLVACVSQSRPDKIHPHYHKIIQGAIHFAEDEALKMHGEHGSECLSSALAVSRFVNTQLKALRGETNCVDYAFVKQPAHIGLGHILPYMTTIVRLGRHGVLSAHMPKINGFEAHCLKRASMFIRENIRLGESFVTGEQKKGKSAVKKN
ncbi:malate dehydrogenase, mitochondrial [Dendroctonus ponderosae]|uniref:malate dehydrogenase, mitochondrial n=1 Tax=Dendroctonus ponderosae TaxID=77166 RepID=UPI0020357F43|nr:malate dehydrogenase, mitochondrial [Dendroctonus ponderosae]XP_048526667.1 malate dehydrogenase, mitochondrial [Dendroctonus ponderosae]